MPNFYSILAAVVVFTPFAYAVLQQAAQIV